MTRFFRSVKAVCFGAIVVASSPDISAAQDTIPPGVTEEIVARCAKAWATAQTFEKRALIMTCAQYETERFLNSKNADGNFVIMVTGLAVAANVCPTISEDPKMMDYLTKFTSVVVRVIDRNPVVSKNLVRLMRQGSEQNINEYSALSEDEKPAWCDKFNLLITVMQKQTPID